MSTTQPLILLVDDALDMGVILRRYARQAGYAVVYEPDAEAAWAFLQQARRPDLAILDLNLPGASGTDLCQKIRGTPAYAQLRIALFSHFQRGQDVAAGLEAGADFILSKDLLCKPDEWQQRIGEILRPPSGRLPPEFLGWMQNTPHDPRQLAVQLNQALRRPPVWQLGAEVVQALVRRAWQQTLQAPPGGNSPDARDTNGWLSPDGHGLDPERFAVAAAPEVALAFTKALAEQMWCLLGGASSAAVWVAPAAPPAASPLR
jgi:DNA-binding response OmpR family regulator